MTLIANNYVYAALAAVLLGLPVSLCWVYYVAAYATLGYRRGQAVADRLYRRNRLREIFGEEDTDNEPSTPS